MLPLVLHPPAGKQRLKPSGSRAHRNEQHSRSFSHGSKLGRQKASGWQNPPLQVSEQHCAAAEQGSPAARHQGRASQRFEVWLQRPEQHSPSLAQPSPDTRQAAPLPSHFPLLHVPEQQFELSVQAVPAVKQPPPPAEHLPLSQRFEQQSRFAWQLPPVAAQAPAPHTAAPPLAWQESPQQSAAASHALPAALHA